MRANSPFEDSIRGVHTPPFCLKRELACDPKEVLNTGRGSAAAGAGRAFICFMQGTLGFREKSRAALDCISFEGKKGTLESCNCRDRCYSFWQTFYAKPRSVVVKIRGLFVPNVQNIVVDYWEKIFCRWALGTTGH